MSFPKYIPLLPEDAILNLPKIFKKDPRLEKVNLGIGVYRNADGDSLVLDSVRKAENLLALKHLNKEYLPIEGDTEFLHLAAKLLFGDNSPLLDSKKLFLAQTIGGCGALRVAGEFLAQNVSKSLFISQQTWLNHRLVFEKAGLNVGSYPYLNESQSALDFSSLCGAIEQAPANSIFVFQASCHNPTGFDPTFEQWKELAALIKKKNLIPFFDCAYQGFGDGLKEDVQGIRYFAEQEIDMLVAYSFSKNFALYGERLGFLSVISHQEDMIPKVASQIKVLIRGNYSNPPIHAPRLIATLLKSPELVHEWEAELKNMRDRIIEMRNAFVAALLIKGHNNRFSSIHSQKGLFSLFGITPEQVIRLREEKAIYLTWDGRINMAGLNTQNMDYVAESIINLMR